MSARKETPLNYIQANEVPLMKTKTLLIVIILIGLVVGALGYFLFLKVFIPNMM